MKYSLIILLSLVVLQSSNGFAVQILTQEQAQAEKKRLNRSDKEHVIVFSVDAGYFVLPVSAAKQSVTLKHLLEDAGTSQPIPLPNINNTTLASVTAIMRSLDGVADNDKRRGICAKDLSVVDDYIIVGDLLMAANYLDVSAFLDAALDRFSDLIFGANLSHLSELDQKAYDSMRAFLDKIPRDLQSEILKRNPIYDQHAETSVLSSANSPIKFSLDGRLMATGGGGGVKIWELDETDHWQIVSTLELPAHMATSWPRELDFAFSHDGHFIVTAYHYAGGNGERFLTNFWRVYPRVTNPKSLGQNNETTSVAMSPTGRYILLGQRNGSVNIVRYSETGQMTPAGTFEVSVQEVKAVAFSPNGNRIVTLGDTELKLWSFNVEHPTATLVETIHQGAEASALIFSPDGRYLAIKAGKKIIVNKVEKSNKLNLFETIDTGSAIASIAFHPSSRGISSGTREPVVAWRMWPIAEGKQAKADWKLSSSLYGGRAACAFTPDGKYFVTDGFTGLSFYRRLDPAKISLSVAQIIKHAQQHEVKTYIELPPIFKKVLARNCYANKFLFGEQVMCTVL